MNHEDQNKKSLSEPATTYKASKPTQGLGKDFDFDERFKNGLTPEEFLAEMKKRIQKYPWKK